MKTIHNKTKIKKVPFLLVLSLFFSVGVYAQGCGGDGYGLKPPADGIDLALRASMDFDNSLNAVMVRNQAIVYGPNTVGTPYTQPSFTTAKIAPVNKVYLVRYNALTDEMEVKSNAEEDVLVISKKKNYVINQHQNNITYRVLEKVGDDAESELGYYISLEDNDNISLYKKECKRLIKREKPSYGSTASTITTEFKKMRCEFYIEKAHNGHAIKIPKRKKEFLALFPEKATAIKEFMKENRIKLNKENSLKKLVKYINTI
jgi:hypothetical protein